MSHSNFDDPPKPRVVIVDMRSGGGIKADGSNIDLPPEGQESALRSIETADVYVQIHADGIYVKEGADKGWVLLHHDQVRGDDER